MVPAVGLLKLKLTALGLLESLDAIKVQWVLRDESTFLKKREDISQIVLGCKGLDVFEELFLGKAQERVADSGLI